MAAVTEEAVLKALNELEEAVEKGDALESASTEGGFSTEGTPLSGQAKGKVVKAKEEEEEEETEVEKAGDFDESEEEGADEEPGDEDDPQETPDLMKKKKKSCAKSFTEAVKEDEPIRKAVEVSDFLEAMVDQTTDALSNLEKSLHETVGTYKTSLEDRIAKSEAHRCDFQSRLAKAVVSIGNQVNELTGIVKSIANQPHVPQRKAVLSKSEMVHPEFRGESLSHGNGSLSPQSVVDWLMHKAETHQMDPGQVTLEVTAYEANGYDVNRLSPNIRKAIEADLLK